MLYFDILGTPSDVVVISVISQDIYISQGDTAYASGTAASYDNSFIIVMSCNRGNITQSNNKGNVITWDWFLPAQLTGQGGMIIITATAQGILVYSVYLRIYNNLF